jgi:hypothetical protein
MPLREREEVQKMLRSLKLGRAVSPAGVLTKQGSACLAGVLAIAAAALAAPAPQQQAIWPEQLAGFTRVSVEPAAPADRALWDEYGLRDAEQARYAARGRKFEAVGYRLNDSTGAFAAFQWQRPADARPSQAAGLAVETRDGALVAYGNYLFRFTGWKPKPADLAAFFQGLKKVDRTALPVLPKYLPAAGLIPNSERYVLGPVSLEKFAGAVPAAVAAFQFGTEGAIGTYQTKGGAASLAIFSYPTPQIARQRLADFEKLPGAVANRSGSMVAVVVAPPDQEAARKLVGAVRFQGQITWNERVPNRRDNIGDLVVNAFILIGIILALFLAAGLIFGVLRRWIWVGKADEPMILLHIQDRR